MCSLCLLLLIQNKLVDLNDRVCMWIDGFIRFNKKHITIKNILNHTAGLENSIPKSITISQFCNPEFMYKNIQDLTPTTNLNEKCKYAYLTYGWIVSLLVNAVSRKKIHTFLKKEILEPINLQNDIFLGPILIDHDDVDFKPNDLKFAQRKSDNRGNNLTEKQDETKFNNIEGLNYTTEFYENKLVDKNLKYFDSVEISNKFVPTHSIDNSLMPNKLVLTNSIDNDNNQTSNNFIPTYSIDNDNSPPIDNQFHNMLSMLQGHNYISTDIENSITEPINNYDTLRFSKIKIDETKSANSRKKKGVINGILDYMGTTGCNYVSRKKKTDRESSIENNKINDDHVPYHKNPCMENISNKITTRDTVKHNRIVMIERKIKFSTITSNDIIQYISTMKYTKNTENKFEKSIHPLYLLKYKPYILDPLLLNSEQIMSKSIPPLNSRLTAYGLCHLFDSLINNKLLNQEMIDDVSTILKIL